MDIRVNQIKKSYDGKVVLQDISFVIKENKITCLMGPSGSGKTTLLSILLGLTSFDEGHIEGMSDKKKAVVFQEDRLVEHLSGLMNVRLVTGREITHKEIVEGFHAVGLAGKETMRVSKMSGGMKRRVAILRALFAESDVVFMDEPLKGLDDKLKETVISYMKEKLQGKTVLVVTHDKEEASMLGAEIVHVSLEI